MTKENMPKTGRCRCGETTFQVAGPPLITMACHCTGCQRMTGSAFSLSALYPGASFTLMSGEPAIGGLRGKTRHYFCPQCMSWLYTCPDGQDDLINVRATMFDDAQSFAPFIETYMCEKLPWAETSAEHSFERFPAVEDYPQLLAEFAK